MKNYLRTSCMMIAGLLLALPTLHAQSYSIDWLSIDGGGGTSTGGVYSVSGTIGPPDASGPMTGGQYSITGGFWALPTAVQVADAPTLTIVHATPGNATISWTPNTPGYVLQETWYSGDDKAVMEAQAWIPGIVGVVVKQGRGLESAIHLPHEEACRLLRQRAAEACRNRNLRGSFRDGLRSADASA